ncbi:MAG: response regulator transcription factor [Candidatus Nanopelagicales bacterium]
MPDSNSVTRVSTIRVFLLDDHEVVRRGIAELLSAHGQIEIVGEAATAEQALDRIPSIVPDVAVLDVQLPDGDGIEVCSQLVPQLPDTKFLILTSFLDDDAMMRAIVAGASGYVLKEIRGTDLTAAVVTVANGGSLMDPQTTARVMRQIRDQATKVDPLDSLTDQERKILNLIGAGMTNKEIGDELFLAEKTVKNYVSSILSKLGLQRRTQAAVLVAKSNS